MPKHDTNDLLDQETLNRMDADFQAGKYDTIDLPPMAPLDPMTDPFGMKYEWLQDVSEYEAAFAKMLRTFPSELLRNSARAFRGITQTESFASGSDEEVFKAWIRDHFIPLCRASQQALLQRIVEATEPSFQITGEVITLLRRELGLEVLPTNDQVSIGYAVIDLVRNEINRSA